MNTGHFNDRPIQIMNILLVSAILMVRCLDAQYYDSGHMNSRLVFLYYHLMNGLVFRPPFDYQTFNGILLREWWSE